MVAHERLTEPRVTIKLLLAKPRSFSNLLAFLILNGTWSKFIGDDMSLIIPPWQRIDLTTLASAFSTIDPFYLSKTCHQKFDIFFKTKPFYCSGGNLQRFDSLFRYLDMEWEEGNKLFKHDGECHLDKTIPDNSRLPTNGGPIHLPSSKKVLDSFYSDDGKGWKPNKPSN